MHSIHLELRGPFFLISLKISGVAHGSSASLRKSLIDAFGS